MAKNKQTDRTEKILKDTFVQALKKMPIEKIQVTTLCNLRGFDRSTFYRHYEDIYDLLSSVEDDLVDELSKLEEDLLKAPIDGINPSKIIPEFIFNKKVILKTLFTHGDGIKFFKKLDIVIQRIFLNKACSEFVFPPEITQKELEYTIEFFSCGYHSIYFDILNGKSQKEVFDMLKIAFKISYAYLDKIAISKNISDI